MDKVKLTYEQTKEKALSLLSFAANTEQELFRKLVNKGAEEDDARAVVDFCREYGLVCDRDYALKKAKDLINLKKFGKHRIISELRHKGISDEDIDYALSELEIPQEIPVDLLIKKLGGDFSKKNIDKTIRFFITKGYDIYNIKQSIERITENEL